MVLAGFLIWDLGFNRPEVSQGYAHAFFDRFFFWAFVGLVGLLLWSSVKALRGRLWRGVLVVAVAAAVALTISGTAAEFPDLSGPQKVDNKIDDGMDWMVTHWRGFFIGIRDGLLKVMVPLEDRLLQVPWWLFGAVLGLLAWRVSGYRMVLVTFGCLLFLLVFGLWDKAMETTAVVGSATFISMAVAIPVGIAMAKSNVLDGMLRPVLDMMQVMPAFVYLIPAIFLLGLGTVPAMLATMVYATPPAMRLTNLGVRLVSPELKEAARAFGTTGWQLLFKVEIPMARPTIMAGVNQTVMMALAMVVIASLVGSRGLGSDVLAGVAQLETGRGLMAGLGIVAMAIVIDRISQGLAKDPRQSRS